MKSMTFRSALATAITLALGATPAAFAADAAATDDTVEDAHRTEQIVVSAKGTAADTPDALATEVVHVDDAVAHPSDVQDLITRVPGVGATGQNGIFETFSIRGSGANNVGILYAGMPLTAQRRAGVPVSFVEPSLLGEVAVTRGPAVVHYGPGALGGAVSVEPRWFSTPYASASVMSGGDEYVLAGGFGSDNVLDRRGATQRQRHPAADGTPLNTRFDRASAVVQYRTRIDDLELDAMLSPSRTEDIGKSNSRFPARDTIYPHDVHTVGRVRIRHANGFEASVQGHDQSLRTWNRRPGFADTFADVRSLDLGATVQQTIDAGDVVHNVGVEFLGRRNVDAFDASTNIDNRRYSLRDARENGWSLFAISDWAVAPEVALEFGARHSANRPEAVRRTTGRRRYGLHRRRGVDTDAGHRLSLNIANGYRFATLEERFFSGVTAQGEVVGNPDLGSERSFGIDLGHAWTGTDWHSEVHLWRTKVDDLIQLTTVAQQASTASRTSAKPGFGAPKPCSAGRRPTPFRCAPAWRSCAARICAPATRCSAVRRSPRRSRPGIASATPSALPAATCIAGQWTVRASRKWPAIRSTWSMPNSTTTSAADLVSASMCRTCSTRTHFATADALSALAPERSFGVHLTAH
jgi:iron complex outermembrane receptor protein